MIKDLVGVLLMIDSRFIKPEPVRIANLADFNEAKLRDIIADDPTILGLGDLYLKSIEKIQPKAGRLDLLLGDPDDEERYEVELQFGKTDESHIIRCLEYWDIERRRYPQYDHTAVLVAEDITSRFLNVISLFNGFVPLIALKLTAFNVNGQIMLSFVKVLDKVLPSEDEEPEPGRVVTREDWVAKSSEELVSIVDANTGISFLNILKEISPTLKLKYNQQYIGIQENGVANVFTHFVPSKRGGVRVSVRLREEEELNEWMNLAAKLGVIGTKDNWMRFQVMEKKDLAEHHDLLKDLFNSSYKMSQ